VFHYNICAPRMARIKTWLKKYIFPNWLMKFFRPFYHGSLAVLAGWYYGQPSKKLIVIGITGTAGKSTTAQMLSHILNHSGKKCGYITTVSFFDGEKEFINKHGLSMPGGFMLQKQLRQILDNGCKYAVVECTSEGLAQNRHLGINFYMVLFTNLSRAHLEAHGGFDNYRTAKGKLFKDSKVVGVNLDDSNAEYFLNFPAEKKFGVTFLGANISDAKIFQAAETVEGFNLNNQNFQINLAGGFNKYNALVAVGAANILGVELSGAVRALDSFAGIRGRMEPVSNSRGFQIFVDYGCEPASFKAALLAVSQMPHKKIIHVFGSTGGHRDVSKRFEFGKLSAEYADVCVITNDDVYDSNPVEIAKNVVAGIKQQVSSLPAGQAGENNYEVILDRRHAIHHALSIAQEGDIVLITGKGSEQFLVLPGNKRIEWDDVKVVNEELTKF